jgi:hypothetical protein
MRFSRRSIGFALNHPRLALSLAFSRLSYEELLRVIVSKDLDILKHQINRALAWNKFSKLSHIEIDETLQKVTPARRKTSWRCLSRWHSFLYMITRVADPATVVETGVLYGYSSAAILSALADNKKGRLISIDLPTEAHQSVIVDRQYIQVGRIFGWMCDTHPSP